MDDAHRRKNNIAQKVQFQREIARDNGIPGQRWEKIRYPAKGQHDGQEMELMGDVHRFQNGSAQ